MLRRDCGGVRRQLSAFHDEELSVEERIAIAGHLLECPACAVEAEDLRTIAEALRGAAAAIQTDWRADLSGMQSDVLGRVRAEREESLLSRAGRLLDDPRRLWATGCAVVASTTCALLIVGGLAAAAGDHARSLAAAVQVLVDAAQVRARGPVVLPRVNSDAVMPAAALSQRGGENAVSAFTAVVTPDGRLVEVQLLDAESSAGKSGERTPQLTADLLAAAATARFEPARIAGAPVAVNVVWLLASTTVRGKLVDDKPVRVSWPRGEAMPAGRTSRSRAQRLSLTDAGLPVYERG
jgi:anti-sigma factor RsiW